MFARFYLIVFALLCLIGSAAAKPPTLDRISGDDFSTEMRPGQPYQFSLTYKGEDAPKKLNMIVQTPNGETLAAPAPIPSGDPATGIPVTWTYTPEEAGKYLYHFEATSQTGESVRFPASPADDFQAVSVSLTSKIIIFIVGLLVGLLFLPFVVYVLARAANKRGNPAAAARVGLLIGVLASLGLYLYLFFSVFGGLGIAIASIAALALLIIIFTRR